MTPVSCRVGREIRADAEQCRVIDHGNAAADRAPELCPCPAGRRGDHLLRGIGLDEQRAVRVEQHPVSPEIGPVVNTYTDLGSTGAL